VPRHGLDDGVLCHSGDYKRPIQSMDRIKVRVFDTDMFTDDLVGETEHALQGGVSTHPLHTLNPTLHSALSCLSLLTDLQLEPGKEQPFSESARLAPCFRASSLLYLPSLTLLVLRYCVITACLA